MTRIYTPRNYVHFMACRFHPEGKHPLLRTGMWAQGQIICAVPDEKNWWLIKPKSVALMETSPHQGEYLYSHVRYMLPREKRTWESYEDHDVWFFINDNNFGKPVHKRSRLWTQPSGAVYAEAWGDRYYVGKTAFLTEEAAMRRWVGKLDKAVHSGYLRQTNPGLVEELKRRLAGAPKVYTGRTG